MSKKVVVLGAALAGAFGLVQPAHAIGVNTGDTGLINESAGDIPTHFVSATCTFHITGNAPGSNNVLVAYGGEAHAAGHTAVASTFIKCEVFNKVGTTTYSDSAQAALPGNSSAVADTATLPLAPITVCVTASALFADGHTANLPRRCQTP